MRLKKESYDEKRPRWVSYTYEWKFCTDDRRKRSKDRSDERENVRELERESDGEEQRMCETRNEIGRARESAVVCLAFF